MSLLSHSTIQGTVFGTKFNPDALIDHVVKITDPTSQEADIYDQLLRHAPASPNHTLPCQIIRSDVKSPVILMPYLQVLACSPLVDRDTATILDIFSQILEVSNGSITFVSRRTDAILTRASTICIKQALPTWYVQVDVHDGKYTSY